jgi:hypothetical protein
VKGKDSVWPFHPNTCRWNHDDATVGKGVVKIHPPFPEADIRPHSIVNDSNEASCCRTAAERRASPMADEFPSKMHKPSAGHLASRYLLIGLGDFPPRGDRPFRAKSGGVVLQSRLQQGSAVRCLSRYLRFCKLLIHWNFQNQSARFCTKRTITPG